MKRTNMKWTKFIIALVGVIMAAVSLDTLLPQGNWLYLIGMWLGINLFVGVFTLEDYMDE